MIRLLPRNRKPRVIQNMLQDVLGEPHDHQKIPLQPDAPREIEQSLSHERLVASCWNFSLQNRPNVVHPIRFMPGRRNFCLPTSK